MKLSYECGPCFLRQAKEALDLSTDDEALKMEVMGEIFNFLSDNFKLGANSNSTGSAMHNLIKQKTGCRDPYRKEKIEGNEIALKYLPDVKRIIEEDDSLENYVKIAIIGNILDFGAFTLDDDIESVIKKSLEKDLAVRTLNNLKSHLSPTAKYCIWLTIPAKLYSINCFYPKSKNMTWTLLLPSSQSLF